MFYRKKNVDRHCPKTVPTQQKSPCSWLPHYSMYIQYTTFNVLGIFSRVQACFSQKTVSKPQKLMQGCQLVRQISSTTPLDFIHNSARYYPLLGQISSTTQLDFIHYSTRSRKDLGQISSTTPIWLNLIHNLARSHPQLGQISSTRHVIKFASFSLVPSLSRTDL